MAGKGLTRESIVAAAFDVLDDVGLEALTARTLAARLGVQAGALYYHLPDMATLYDEMATELTRRMMRAADLDTGTWPDLMTGYGTVMRRTLLGVRDGGRLYAGRRLRDPALLTGMERPLEIMLAAGFALEQAVWVMQTVLDVTVGFVIEEQHRAADSSGGYDPEVRAASVGEASPLTAAAGEPMAGSPDVQFAFAMQLLVDGAAVHARPNV